MLIKLSPSETEILRKFQCNLAESPDYARHTSIIMLGMGNSPSFVASVRILVELRMSNDLHLTQKNLSYQDLKSLIEKLEGLC